MEVVLAERGAMRQAHLRHELDCGLRTLFQGGEQPRYLIAYLVVCLVAQRGVPDGLQDSFLGFIVFALIFDALR